MKRIELEKEIAAFKEKIPGFEAGDRERIENALELAQGNSAGVALILLDLGLDADTIVSALLRQAESAGDRFGPDAALLAEGLKKIDGLKTASKTVFEAQNIRNMIFAMVDDIRIIFIKLAEKLYAMRILDASDGDERKSTARECLDIYAPLADRLGISWIKNEMEDLSLKFTNRETYQQIKSIVSQKRDSRDKFLEFAKKAIAEETKAAGISVEVESRAKHFYSVYMKMRKRGISAEKIHDLLGIRIICDSIENCYTLLGIVHSLWKPLSGCFKDYIANPKPNGYQSLHTTVISGEEAAEEESTGEESQEEKSGEEGRALEIQIRTKEMHQIAENGVASHWLYKRGSSRDVVQSQDIGVINSLKNWRQDGQAGSSSSWLEDIRQGILKNWIYVFTPQGNVIKLPSGSTPIDFAYQIHTAVAEHCIGAKANGSIIQLSSQLKNTQVVEILTSPQAHPHLNWLELARSSKARSKIRSWLEKNDESFIIEKPAEPKKKTAAEPPAVQPAGKKEAAQKTAQTLASFLKVRIADEKNMMIRFARCCNPVPGDQITGYVSRGRGIIIHRKNCASISRNTESEKRNIEAAWDNVESDMVKRFSIEAKPSANLFSEIEGAVRKRNGHLIEGRLEETAANRLSGVFAMQLAKTGDLKPIMKNIRSIPEILKIQNLN